MQAIIALMSQILQVCLKKKLSKTSLSSYLNSMSKVIFFYILDSPIKELLP